MSGNKTLNNTVRKSILGGIICGVGAGIGGLIGGPIGIGVGSAVGGLLSSAVLRFRSAPNVIQNDLQPNERRDLLERGVQTMTDVKEYLIRVLLQLLAEIRDCKTFEEFKCRVLVPILGDLIGLGVAALVRNIFAALA